MNKTIKQIERCEKANIPCVITLMFRCDVPLKNYYAKQALLTGYVIYYDVIMTTKIINEIMEWEIPFLISNSNLKQVYRNHGNGFYYKDVTHILTDYLANLSDVEEENINKFKIFNLI